jgi:hypothetical protein
MLVRGKFRSTPTTVTNLTAEAIADTEIQLSFSLPAHASIIQYRLDGGAAATLAADLIITGLTASTAYDIEVRGYVSSTIFGAWSNVATATTVASGAGPVVANQSMSFGRLTISGAGACPLVHTGDAVTSITLGTRTTGSNHFTTSADRLAPTAVPTDAQYVWTGCTATGAGGTSAEFTLTINTTANAYSVRATELGAAVTAIGTASSGARSILLREGDTFTSTDFSATRLKNKAFVNTVTIKGHDDTLAAVDGDAVPTIDAQVIIDNVDNLTLHNLDIGWTGATTNTQKMVEIKAGSTNIIVEDCYLHGEYRDPTVNYDAPTYYDNPTLIGGITGSPSFNTTVQRCLLEHGSAGCAFGRTGGPLYILDNVFRYIAGDTIQVGPGAGDTTLSSGECHIKRNVFSDYVDGEYLDGTAVHIDVMQLFTTSASEAWTGLEIEQNIAFGGASGSSRRWFQGIFQTASGSTHKIQDAIITDNIMLCGHDNGLIITHMEGGRITGNLVSHDYENGLRYFSSGAAKIWPGSSASAGTITVAGNVAENIILGGAATYVDEANLIIGEDGATYAFSTLFVGATYDPETRAEVLTKFANKNNGPLDADNSGTVNTGDLGPLGGHSTFATNQFSSAGAVSGIGVTYWVP